MESRSVRVCTVWSITQSPSPGKTRSARVSDFHTALSLSDRLRLNGKVHFTCFHFCHLADTLIQNNLHPYWSPVGIKPTTLALQAPCSTNWATRDQSGSYLNPLKFQHHGCQRGFFDTWDQPVYYCEDLRAPVSGAGEIVTLNPSLCSL